MGILEMMWLIVKLSMAVTLVFVAIWTFIFLFYGTGSAIADFLSKPRPRLHDVFYKPRCIRLTDFLRSKH